MIVGVLKGEMEELEDELMCEEFLMQLEGPDVPAAKRQIHPISTVQF